MGSGVPCPELGGGQNSEFKTGASLSRSFKHISCIPTLRKEERRLQTIHSCVTLRRCEQGVCIKVRTRTYCERIWPLDATGTMHRNVPNYGVRLAMWENVSWNQVVQIDLTPVTLPESVLLTLSR